MIPLTLSPPGRPLRALFLGAHADDIEIGCGGTIRRLIDASAGLEAHWRVFSASDEREAETRRAAEILLEGASAATVEVDRFRESYLPWQGDVVKERVAGLAALDPDVVFTHARHDRHQDHRLLSDLTWNTFRDQLVLEYEIPKWDGDLVTPNLYVPLDRAQVDTKLRALREAFTTQAQKPWFDEETFRGLMRLRGVECAAPERFAEAFHIRKAVMCAD